MSMKLVQSCLHLLEVHSLVIGASWLAIGLGIKVSPIQTAPQSQLLEASEKILAELGNGCLGKNQRGNPVPG